MLIEEPDIPCSSQLMHNSVASFWTCINVLSTLFFSFKLKTQPINNFCQDHILCFSQSCTDMHRAYTGINVTVNPLLGFCAASPSPEFVPCFVCRDVLSCFRHKIIWTTKQTTLPFVSAFFHNSRFCKLCLLLWHPENHVSK